MKGILKRRNLVFYTALVAGALIVILLVNMIASTSNTGYEDTQPVDSENGTNTPTPDDDEDEENDETEDVVNLDEVFKIPMSVNYSIRRNYWHTGLSDEEKREAQLNNESMVGVTLIEENNEQFEVISPISGTITEVSEDDRGQFIVIDAGNVRISIHSLSNINVAIDDIVSQDDKLGMSSENAHDTEVGQNIYMELKVQKEYKWIPVNPINYLGEKVDKIIFEEK